MAEVGPQYYILLKAKSAEKRDKSFSTYPCSEKKPVDLLEGEILIKVCEKDQPKETTLIKLKPFEMPLVTLQCTTTDVQRIDEEEANLLLPLCSLSERLRVFQERNGLKTGKKMDVDCHVWITVPVKSIKREFPGIIKYKGPLPGRPGTMFGVELLLDGVGKGTTDGFFRGKHHFHCSQDSGMFVSLEKLSLRSKDSKSLRKDSKHKTEINGGNVESLKKDNNKSEQRLIRSTLTKQFSDDSVKSIHKVGDVVWVFINEKPQRGKVRYIGRPPGEKDVFAGIELDNKFGKGDGEYYKKYLFSCKKDHAHFSPISNVISNEQYGQMHQEGSNDFSSLKEKFFSLFSIQKNVALKEQQPSTGHTSSADIVQMESNFSKLSENAVIKEQEELFRRAQAEAKGQKPREDKACEKEYKHKSAVDKRMNSTQHDNRRELLNKNSNPQDIVKDTSKENYLSTALRNGATSNTLYEKSQEKTKVTSSSMGDRMQPIPHSLNNGNYSSNSPGAEYSHGVETQGNSLSRGIRRSSNETSHLSENQPNFPSGSIQADLDIGSVVEVLSKHSAPKFGLIRWIGFLPNSTTNVAGLEMEEEMEACTDGTFLGKRYFHCPNRRGFFVHLRNCKPDSRFGRGRSSMVSTNKRLTGTDFGNFKSPIIIDRFVPPADSLHIYIGPPQLQGSEKNPRGIQGHHNSCYLDATLFAIFAFSSVMDSILLRSKGPKDIEQYEKVQDVLRDNIVYPLRSNGFVRADRVFELRQLLDRLGTVTGLVGEEKDPEEFLMTLLQQVLKQEPFLKIKLGDDVRKEYFYQVLADKDVERVLPSVQELLKRSFYQSKLKLTEVPSCLIVQMPRFGKGFKMYDRIIPSLTINIGVLVDNAPQDCAVCGSLATFYCYECVTITGFGEDCSGNFCKVCNSQRHSHVARSKHNFRPLRVSQDICAHYANSNVEHQEMELFAVVCIETSHYVTFAKCPDVKGESRWCFFDSMADRVSGSKNGYNIPCVTECNEVVEWLSSEKENRDRIIRTEDKEMPEKVRRILGDAYMCLYQSVEMSMYK